MNFFEYEKVKELNYYNYVDYLKNKYGASTQEVLDYLEIQKNKLDNILKITK